MVAAIIVVISVGGGSRARHPSSRGARLFAADSIWNAPLAAGAPVDPHSTAYVQQLREQVAHYGDWINTDQYSVPLYTVPRQAKRVPVVLDASGYSSANELGSVFRAGVPVPSTATAAQGSDASLAVWQPSTNTLWEFWQARRVNGVWHARWGGRIADVSRSPGYYTDPSDWGGSASSLSIAGGMILPSEVRAGAIDHALAIAIPHAAAGRYVFPAQRDDGNDHSAAAIPEGTRFRLRHSVNIAALHLPPLTAMIARAAQRYGLLVRDQSGAVVFYGEDPVSTGGNPWGGAHGLLENTPPSKLLAGFPWQDLEVVTPPSRASGG